MVKSLKGRITDLIIKKGLLSKEQLKEALRIQKQKGGALSDILVSKGWIKQEELMGIMGKELNIPPINLSHFKITPEVVKLVPERLARHYSLIPISKLGKRLVVAMADPLNIFAADDIKALTGYEIDPVITTAKDIKESIEKYYQEEDSKEIEEIVKEADASQDLEFVETEEVDIGEVTAESKAPPVVKMVNLILQEALGKRASDIHIEPSAREVRVRYRIDGNLQKALTIPKKSQNALIARLKIMSGMDITESRIPQDGRFRIKLGDREVDFRVSVLPITYGGKVVMRALDKSSLSIGLEKLGFLPESLEAFKKGISKPYGMILVTGPTGSGKSTTLYSILNQLNTPDKNIITIEDPVEYRVEGITQVQVKPEIGLSFANGLKSLLRQSPDVIMVGEIRDFETADTAVKSALTGQLILSTLHTNDAPSAVTRLIDMGVEPFLVASSLLVATAQRLCRKICPYCKEEHKIPKEVLERVGIKTEKGQVFYKGKGCARCSKTGYYGRLGTMEVFSVDQRLREMIVARVSTDELRDYAKEKGMKTLWENAVSKFLAGETTLEEVLRVTAKE